MRRDADGALFQLQFGQIGDLVGLDMGPEADAKAIKQALSPRNVRFNHVKVDQNGGGFEIGDQGHLRTRRNERIWNGPKIISPATVSSSRLTWPAMTQPSGKLTCGTERAPEGS